MVGIAAAMMGKPGAVSGAGTLSISPASGATGLANGAAYSQNFTASTTGMVGPVTYAWSWQSGGVGISLTNTTTATVTASSAGRTNVEIMGALQCVATDTGNGNRQYTAAVDVDVVWGTP